MDYYTIKSDAFATPINKLPTDPSLAIAYVPFQTKFEVYPSDEGLDKGTIFPALYKPFTGKRGVLK